MFELVRKNQHHSLKVILRDRSKRDTILRHGKNQHRYSVFNNIDVGPDLTKIQRGETIALRTKLIKRRGRG